MNSYTKMRTDCPICGNKNSSFLRTHRFAELSESTPVSSYDLCFCGDCDLAFGNNILSQAEYDAFYSSNNKYGITLLSEINDSHKTLIDYVVKNIGKNMKILDVGCGYGYELRALKKQGYTNLHAIDTYIMNCEMLQEIGISAKCKSAFEISESEYMEKFDVIMIDGVLEHIVDMHGFIDRILSVLSNNGKLVISVPATQFNHGKRIPFENFSVEHIQYFTFRSLDKLCKMHSLEPKKILNNDSENFIAVVYERAISADVFSYIDDSMIAVEQMLTKVDFLIESQAEVCIWGVGSLCRYLLANTRFSDLNIIAFVDNNPDYYDKQLIYKTQQNISIYSPDILYSLNIDTPIIICSYFAGEKIENTISEKLKLRRRIIRLT